MSDRVQKAREALVGAIHDNDREIDRVQGLDFERVAVPLVDALIAAVREEQLDAMRKMALARVWEVVHENKPIGALRRSDLDLLLAFVLDRKDAQT